MLKHTTAHRRHPKAKPHSQKPAPSPKPGHTGEAVKDFPNREGYDENFLGIDLPLPKPDPELMREAAPLLAHPDKVELEYTHFSVIQDKERRTPMLTAENIDGATYHELERSGKWAFDSRIDRQYQVGNEAYADNAIDKGHMVRRRDPMWGSQASQANQDTFVYTNAALQHSELNQHHWLDLENSILNKAVANDQKVSVFTGPVLRDDDPSFDNHGHMDHPTQIPQAFWKLAVWNDGHELKGEAYVMSQADLLDHPQATRTVDHLTPEQLESYRVPLAQLEQMTHIDFGSVDA